MNMGMRITLQRSCGRKGGRALRLYDPASAVIATASSTAPPAIRRGRLYMQPHFGGSHAAVHAVYGLKLAVVPMQCMCVSEMHVPLPSVHGHAHMCMYTYMCMRRWVARAPSRGAASLSAPANRSARTRARPKSPTCRHMHTHMRMGMQSSCM